MREEIAAAVIFLGRLVKRNDNIDKDTAQKFSDKLTALLLERYKNHWYDDVPNKGQAYRCIRIDPKIGNDPMLVHAAEDAGLKFEDLRIPSELTIWVDPKEVVCRFGDKPGCCQMALYKEGDDQNAHTINIDGMLAQDAMRRNAEQSKILKIASSRQQNRQSTSKALHDLTNYSYQNMQHVCYSKDRANGSSSPFQPTYKKGGMQQKNGHTGSLHPGKKDRFHWVRGADLVKA